MDEREVNSCSQYFCVSDDKLQSITKSLQVRVGYEQNLDTRFRVIIFIYIPILSWYWPVICLPLSFTCSDQNIESNFRPLRSALWILSHRSFIQIIPENCSKIFTGENHFPINNHLLAVKIAADCSFFLQKLPLISACILSKLREAAVGPCHFMFK